MRNLYYVGQDPNAFYTAVFDAYKDKNAYLVSEDTMQPTFDDVWITVTENDEKTERVLKKIHALDSRAAYETDLILRSNHTEKAQIAFEYIRLLVKTGKPVRHRVNEASVRAAMDITQAVSYELHRMKGFIRFKETDGGVLYAPFSPDHQIVDLLAPHFFRRMGGTPFVLHDVKRGLAVLSNGRERIFTQVGDAQFFISEREENIERLWKKYYKTVAITERTNTRQMKAYMPVRYWKFLPEKQELD